MNSTIKAISFDAGGTLITPSPSVGEVYQILLGELGIQADALLLDSRFKTAYAKATQKSKTDRGFSNEKLFWRHIVTEVIEPLNLNGLPIDQLFEHLFNGFAKGKFWKLLPEALPVLKELKHLNIPLILITNSDSRIRTILKDLMIDCYFLSMTISAEHKTEKPDSQIFKIAQDTLPFSGKEILHVGDSWSHDVEGALNFGWNAFHLDFKTRTLPDIIRYLNGEISTIH